MTTTNQMDGTDSPIEADGAAIGLGDVLPIMQRRWFSALIAFVLTVIVVLILTLRITPLYEARAVITIDYGLKALDFQRDDADSERVELNMLNTVRDQLVAVPILRETIATSGLASSPAYRSSSDPTTVLKSRIKANTAKDSLSISLTLRDEYPERAQQALGLLLAAYQGKLVQAKDDKSQNALAFLRSQRDEELSRLEVARAAETDYMNRMGIVSNNAETNPLSQRLAALNSQLVANDAEIATGSALHQQVLKALALPQEQRVDALLAIDTIARDPMVYEQSRVVARDADEVGALQSRFGVKHPKLIEAQTAYITAREQLKVSVEAASTVVVSSQNRRLELAGSLRTLIAEQEQKLKDYRKSLLALSALSEVTASHSQLYQTILTRLNEMEVDSSLNERKTKIIDPPTASDQPVNVNLPLFAALALVLGLLAACGTAMAMETTDTRIYGARQIQRLTGLPLIGQVPQSAGIVPLGRDGDPESPPHVAEAFRHIRAAVRLARHNPSGCERIAIVSCTPGEGKSTVTSRLAMSLASMGARVLLIDADMRKPTQDNQLGEHASHGLSQLLAGAPGIAPLATARANLDFLGVGVIPTNPGELLLSPLFPEALDAFSAVYDYIIIDTPPLSLVADALSISEHMDDVVLVLRDGFTDKDMLNLVISRIAPMASKVIGFVLNGDRSRAAAYYGKQYSHGYGRDGSQPAPAST